MCPLIFSFRDSARRSGSVRWCTCEQFFRAARSLSSPTYHSANDSRFVLCFLHTDANDALLALHLPQNRMKKDAELMGRIASSVKRATRDSAGSSRAPKRPSPASTPYRADAVFDDCVSWPVAKVASQLQRSVGCDRDAVNSLFRSFVVENDLSGSAIACLDLSAIVKLFDDALTTAGLKTIGLHAAMSFFLSRMKSFI